MNPYLKTSIAVVSLLALVGYFLFNTASNEGVQSEKQNASINGLANIAKAEPSSEELPLNKSTPSLKQHSSLEQQIEQLELKANQQQAKILSMTGPDSGKNIMHYEDDWCKASQDLTEQDQIYAETKMEEWKLNQGWVGITDNSNPYYVPYKEADLETLFQLAKQDDPFALITIMERPNVELETQNKAAKRLLVLGHTSSAISHLTAYYFTLAKHYQKSNPDKSLSSLKKALVYTEFGLMRNNLSDLGILLSQIEKHQKGDGGVDLGQLTQDDFIEVKRNARSIHSSINEARANMGLPTFEEIDNSKEAKAHNAYMLFWYHRRSYPDVMNSEILPASWKNAYLQETPCFKRQLAMHKFEINELPAIKKKIAKLEQELD